MVNPELNVSINSQNSFLHFPQISIESSCPQRCKLPGRPKLELTSEFSAFLRE